MSQNALGQGPYFDIHESPQSATFSHPERYLIDAPIYGHDAADSDRNAANAAACPRRRFDGGLRFRSDTVDNSARFLSQDLHKFENYEFSVTQGLTHLRIVDNQVSSLGIHNLLHIPNHHLEALDCGSTPLLAKGSQGVTHWPAGTDLRGILGVSHLVRPLFSSNLRALRIHHSFVTHILSLQAREYSHLERLCLAETSICKLVDQAYRLPFVPDMNPRLTILTLTDVPRYSCSPLIQRLIEFLTLLSEQERAIQGVAAKLWPHTWRNPGLLMGLRFFTLEFEQDAMEDEAELATCQGGAPAFSFFDDDADQARRMTEYQAGKSHSINSIKDHTVAASDSRSSSLKLGEQSSDDYIFSQIYGILHRVWAGPRVAGPEPNPVLQRYRHLVVHCRLHQGLGRCTPSQVAAGAPKECFIFHTTWCLAAIPPKLRAPAPSQLAGMRNVIGEIRNFRRTSRNKYRKLQQQSADGRAPVLLGKPHLFWTGSFNFHIPLLDHTNVTDE